MVWAPSPKAAASDPQSLGKKQVYRDSSPGERKREGHAHSLRKVAVPVCTLEPNVHMKSVRRWGAPAWAPEGEAKARRLLLTASCQGLPW